MMDERVRHFFAGIPGMHGLTEAALSGWSGTVRILPAGAVLAVGDFMICGGEPGEHGRQTLACMMAEQPREWLLYVPGKWKALLDGLGTFRPVTRQGFQLLRPDAIREDLAAWKSLPPGYTLASMDRADAEACLTADWSRDFVREHGSVEHFLHRGMGILVRDAAGRPAGRRQRVCILALGAGSSASDAPGPGRKRAGYRGGGRPAASGTVPGNGGCVGCGKRCIGTHCPEAWLYTGGTIYSVGAADLRATERYKKVQKEK